MNIPVVFELLFPEDLVTMQSRIRRRK